MTRRLSFATAVAVMFMLLYSGSALAIYTWVDEKGITHISDYPRPVITEEHASSGADKAKENAAPVLSERALKADQPQSAGESVLQPSVVAAPVSAPPKNEQPVAPPSLPQPRVDSVPSLKVTPPVLPAQFSAGVGSTVPWQGVPINKSAHGVAMQNSGGTQMIKTLISMFLFILILGYLYFSLCLYFIARKLNVSKAWIAWVPLFQIMTLVESASKPAWWVLLFFVPLVNFVVSIYVWMCISENLGKDKWLGLLMLVPIANLIYLGMLAFSKQDSSSETSIAVA